MPGTMFIQAASLAALPTSGGGWDALVAKSTTDPGTGNLGALDQTHPLAVFSIALRWARDGGGLGQSYAINEIKAVMGTESSAAQPLNPYRTLGAYIMAADLLDMSGTTVGANGQTFDAWMQSWPNKVIPGQSNWNTLEKCARTSPNNWGQCARASLIAVLLWLRKRGLQPNGYDRETLLANAISWYKRWAGDSSVPNTFTATGSFQAGWATTSFPSQQGVVNPTVSGTKAWQSGANCEDASRSTYPTKTGAGQHYQYESLDSALTTVALLINAGYADAAGWGGDGVKRNYQYMISNNLTTPSTDYHHFMWMQPAAANWIWPGLGMPIPSGWLTDRAQRRMLTTHTDWLTSSGSSWLKVAGSGGGSTIVNPTVSFTLPASATVSTAVPLDATGTTAGSANIARHDIDWGDGTTTTINEPTRLASHTFTAVGDYTVKVTAVQTDGGTASASKVISIVAVDGAPVAALSITPTSGTAPLDVTYDMSASFDPNGDPLSYHVDRGDGIVLHNTTATGVLSYATAVTQDTSYSGRAWVEANGLASAAILFTVTVKAPIASGGGVTTAGVGVPYIVLGGEKIPLIPQYDGTWDGAHIAQGSDHLWVDPDGLWRIKTGVPNGPRDGVPLNGPTVLPLAPGDTVPPGTPSGTLFIPYQ